LVLAIVISLMSVYKYYGLRYLLDNNGILVRTTMIFSYCLIRSKISFKKDNILEMNFTVVPKNSSFDAMGSL